MLLARFGGDIQIVIPPPKNAILSADAQDNPTLRDQRITAIRTGGRMAWQVSSGYNQRSRGETHPLMHAAHALPGNEWAVGSRSSAPN